MSFKYIVPRLMIILALLFAGGCAKGVSMDLSEIRAGIEKPEAPEAEIEKAEDISNLSEEEMEATIQFALDHPILKAWFFTVVVYPRMGLTDLAQRSYPELDIDWEKGSYFYFDEITFYEQATGIDLWKKARHAAMRFYLRPGTMYGIMKRFPKNRTLARSYYWGARTVGRALWKDLKGIISTSGFGQGDGQK